MQPANYCTHAIEFLSKYLSSMHKLRPEYGAWTQTVCNSMRTGVKFQVPDGGRILTDSLDFLPERIRLPYPEICIEYAYRDGSSGMAPGFVASPERVLICREITAEEIAAENKKRFASGIYNAESGPFIMFTYVARQKALDLPGGHMWGPGAAWCLFPQRRDDAHSLTAQGLHKSEVGFLAEDFQGWRDYVERNGRKVEEVLSYDYMTEIPVILSLVQALSCTNVTQATIAAPDKLNKHRARAGRPPFFEYKILEIEAPAASIKTPDQGGTHASPKMHLRRGHIRRLSKGNIWINSMVVGRASAGTVVKDYRVAPGAR